jgi:hypothetical protein
MILTTEVRSQKAGFLSLTPEKYSRINYLNIGNEKNDVSRDLEKATNTKSPSEGVL